MTHLDAAYGGGIRGQVAVRSLMANPRQLCGGRRGSNRQARGQGGSRGGGSPRAYRCVPDGAYHGSEEAEQAEARDPAVATVSLM